MSQLFAKSIDRPAPDLRRGLLFHVMVIACLIFFSQGTHGAPTCKSLFPSGAARGKAVTVTASGKFDNWPVRVWIDRQGMAVTCAKDKGKLQVKVDADAVPGVYWVRLHDDSGAAALRPFIVGAVATVTEKEPNNDPTKSQVIKQTTVIDARLAKKGDVDVYAVELEKDQTLVASMLANRVLGSPMDGILQVTDERNHILKQNDEGFGLDPHMVFKAPKKGRYLIRVFAFPATATSSINFAGGDDFIYRLTVTTGVFIDHAIPMAANGKTESRSDQRIDLLKSRIEKNVAVLWHPDAANHLTLPVITTGPLLTEASQDKPQTINTPCTITGRIETHGDSDTFAFKAKKGNSVGIQVNARTLGYPIDPYIRITTDKGKTITAVDDTSKLPDPVVTFKPPADGVYHLNIRDRFGHGGPRYVYRIALGPAESDFELSVAADHFELTPGKPLEIPIAVNRINGFAEAIKISAIDLPPGVTVAAVESKGKTAKAVKLKMTAAVSKPVKKDGKAEKPDQKKAGNQANFIRIVGTATVKGRKIEREATFALSNTGRRGRGVWLTVVKKTKGK